MPVRLLYLVEKPIQYQTPLLRLIAEQPDIDLHVVFEHEGAASREEFDAGFGRAVRWDRSLLDGYSWEVVPDDRGVAERLAGRDALWMHGWAGRRARRALRAAGRAGVPVLMRGDNTPLANPDGAGLRGVLKRRYLSWIFSRCALFLCVGTQNRDYYRSHGASPEQLHAMAYAVDNDFFRARVAVAAARRDAFRSELGLEPGRPVVLFASKFLPRKNVPLIVEAFARLDPERHRHPYLLLVGDGEERGRLEHEARGVAGVRLLGFRNQTELPAFFDLADVFVLASSREPWGLVVNEAMNGECAIVVSDECGCAPDLVPPECGRVLPAGELAPLAAALSELLANPQLCRSLGQAAAQHVRGWGLEASVRGLRGALQALAPSAEATAVG